MQDSRNSREGDTDFLPKTLEAEYPDPRTEREWEIARMGPWFHNLHLPDGVQTAPNHPLGDFPAFKWKVIAPRLPDDISGWTVLDIGCNAGFYSFELARRGAVVTGIDIDDHYLRQAQWAAGLMGLENRIVFRRMQVYDLVHTPETYDLVLFMGVFYHLRFPFLALNIVSTKVKRLMLFQTLTLPGDTVRIPPPDLGIDEREVMRDPGWPKIAFIENRLAGDPTNWWAPNHAAVEAMLRSSGFRMAERIAHEIYLCEPDASDPLDIRSYNRSELLSAAGVTVTQ